MRAVRALPRRPLRPHDGDDTAHELGLCLRFLRCTVANRGESPWSCDESLSKEDVYEAGPEALTGNLDSRSLQDLTLALAESDPSVADGLWYHTIERSLARCPSCPAAEDFYRDLDIDRMFSRD